MKRAERRRFIGENDKPSYRQGSNETKCTSQTRCFPASGLPARGAIREQTSCPLSNARGAGCQNFATLCAENYGRPSKAASYADCGHENCRKRARSRRHNDEENSLCL
ncbi:unnamed protein product [Protopolystoma xenopodis]|uniref:Uncharacterized protein n=1 Tax=Protopolystoma xenopodis TaxID=117903 RepID=A0A448WE62_9PLAT|nr:unnamed protein product [Protopolystoma xenopodis]